MMNKLLALALPLCALVTIARADDEPAVADRWHVSLETDPLNIVLGGGSALVEVAPGPLPRWRFGAVAYRTNLPSFAVSDGWSNVQIELGVGAQAHYYFDRSRRGLFVGMLASLNAWEYTAPAGSATNRQLGVMPQIGYHWFPSKRLGLFLKPWAGVGIPIYTTRDAAVDGMTYEPGLPVAPLVSIHVGWQI
jgi:dihydroflavonol-4-reductase